MDIFDQTQVLDLDEYMDETQEMQEADQGTSISKSPIAQHCPEEKRLIAGVREVIVSLRVGYLKVSKFPGFPETTFPIFHGDNLIGRGDGCNITIPAKPISKKHACIEVLEGTVFTCIYDCNSRNKTRKNKMFLKPHVRYELQSEDELIFADVKCQYFLESCKDEVDEESGSETGSESMLPESNDDLEPGDKSKKIASSPKAEKELNESVETSLLPPTQDYKPKSTGSRSPVFCAETDSETDDEQEALKLSSEDHLGPTLIYSPGDKLVKDELNSSLVGDHTQLCSQAKTDDNTCSMNTTLPATLAVEPDTVPDTVPATPGFFAADDDENSIPGPLKRAADVTSDPFKRLSTGNTLDYGLETLENSNLSRESTDISVSDMAKKKMSEEVSPVKESEKKESGIAGDEEKTGEEIVTVDMDEKSDKKLPDEDTVLDDLMTTQAYDAPAKPESTSSDGEVSPAEEGGDRIFRKGDVGATQAYHVAEHDGEITTKQNGGDKISDENDLNAATLAYGDSEDDGAVTTTQNGEDKISDENDLNTTQAYEAAVDKILDEDDLDATQAYGAGEDENEGDKEADEDMPTQAYGISNNNRASDEETGDDMATQAYGIDTPNFEADAPTLPYCASDDATPAASGDFYGESVEEPAEVKESVKEKETKKHEEEMECKNPTLSKEYETMATGPSVADDDHQSFGVKLISPVIQINIFKKGETRKKQRCKVTFADTSDSDNATTLIPDKKAALKADESSDSADLPSLVELGIARKMEKPATDSEDDFAPRGRRSTRKSANKRTESKRPSSETVSSASKKSPSVRIEGENNLSSNKPCYVERTAENKSAQEKIEDDDQKPSAKSSVTRAKRQSKRKSVTRASTKTSGTASLAREERKSKANDKTPEQSETSQTPEGVLPAEATVQSTQRSKRASTVSETSTRGSQKRGRGRGKKEQGNALAPDLSPGPSASPRKRTRLEPSQPSGIKDELSGLAQASEVREFEDDDQETLAALTKHQSARASASRTSSRRSRTASKTNDETPKQGETSHLPEVVLPPEATVQSTQPSKPASTSSETTTPGSQKRGRGRGKKEQGSAPVPDLSPKPVASPRKRTKLERSQPSSIKDELSGLAQESEIREKKAPKPSEGSQKSGRGRGKKGQGSTVSPDLSPSKTPKSSEEFHPPEATVPSGQRSRRSSTSSETSSQGSQKRGRGRGKKGQGSTVSPDISPGSTASPRKRTKHEPSPPSNIKVQFTGLAQESQARKIVEDLHGEVVESVYDCTHLVTDKVKRTVKFLCALSRGIPIVHEKWLQASKRSKQFIDCSNFTVKDKASEKQYDFSLERSLEMARDKGLLEGYKVHVTPHVVPKPELMKDIIQCAQGEFLITMPKLLSDDVLVVSCDEDKKLYEKAVTTGYVHSSELLLTGVLRQILDCEQFKMTKKEVSTATRSRRR